MIKLTVRQLASMKRTAQNVYPLVAKKNKLQETINNLSIELEGIQAQIDAWEGATKAMTGGYTSEDLITRSVEDTGKVDKNGAPIKVTKYEPNNNLVYNEAEKVYEIQEMAPANVEEVDGDATVDMVADNTFNPASL